MKLRRTFAVVGGGLITATALAGAHFRGWWVPNMPNQNAFPIRGIDVSRHQGPIEWKAVRGGSIQFAYIKATEGGDFRDERFSENWQSAAAAGLRRGAYHFFTLKSSGAAQAANFIAVVPKDPDALPPVVDVELWGNSSTRPSVEDFQRELSVFIAQVKSFYGREPIIYAANDFREYFLRDFPLKRLWIRSVVTAPRLPNGVDWQFWQFSEKVRVPGIQGFVDQDVFHGNSEAFENFLRQDR
jgi:lysozyme